MSPEVVLGILNKGPAVYPSGDVHPAEDKKSLDRKFRINTPFLIIMTANQNTLDMQNEKKENQKRRLSTLFHLGDGQRKE